MYVLSGFEWSISGLYAMSLSLKNLPGHNFVFCSIAVVGKLKPLPSQLCEQAREVTIEVLLIQRKVTLLKASPMCQRVQKLGWLSSCPLDQIQKVGIFSIGVQIMNELSFFITLPFYCIGLNI